MRARVITPFRLVQSASAFLPQGFFWGRAAHTCTRRRTLVCAGFHKSPPRERFSERTGGSGRARRWLPAPTAVVTRVLFFFLKKAAGCGRDSPPLLASTSLLRCRCSPRRGAGPRTAAAHRAAWRPPGATARGTPPALAGTSGQRHGGTSCRRCNRPRRRCRHGGGGRAGGRVTVRASARRVRASSFSCLARIFSAMAVSANIL